MSDRPSILHAVRRNTKRERFHDILESALLREKRIKKWKRDWKINLIERDNPHWIDLFLSLPP